MGPRRQAMSSLFIHKILDVSYFPLFGPKLHHPTFWKSCSTSVALVNRWKALFHSLFPFRKWSARPFYGEFPNVKRWNCIIIDPFRADRTFYLFIFLRFPDDFTILWFSLYFFFHDECNRDILKSAQIVANHFLPRR